ncbi:hypothetical protein HGO23_05895 [Xenorhabdus budapestensis]|uniref:Uncharacterized protein n=1 Tax=Xenorhabdus budapestensis TaxID=290110 RepID=A0ABX7VQ55_XENBU|nr:hypothetical protein [Xenorhabdus budapestensis]QTL40878.1 hypothetical protein HGO23_05895 [Xenorhabdus budapestensis]
MEKPVFQWLFSASQPYCLQVPVTCLSEPARVQLDWRFVDKEEYRLYLSAGREYRLLGDGDVTVFRLTDMQWQAIVEGNAEAQPEQWERQPFTLSELAVHPEFATFTAIGTTESGSCRK